MPGFFVVLEVTSLAPGKRISTVLYELTARKLYTCRKADIHAYVMVVQNINREPCRRPRASRSPKLA